VRIGAQWALCVRSARIPMLSRSFDDIAEVVLGRKGVYSLDVDARIREAADRLSAGVF
jgi:hypothetical protein